MEERYVKDLLLANSRYWIISKELVDEVGIESAFLLTNLAEAEKLMADDEGWFYQTIGTVEEMTTLSRYKQDVCINQLVELGWIQTDTRGIPPKRFFKLNYDEIAKSLLNTTSNQIVKNSQIDMQETDKLICKKLATNKEHIYKEHNNKESNKESTPRLSKEEIEQVITKWNEVGLAQIRVLSPNTERYKSLRARISEYGLGDVLEAIDNINYSSFLKGDNGRKWKISFDWLVKPNNFIKVLEGQYTNQEKPIPANKPNKDTEDIYEVALDDDGNPLTF